MTTGEGFHMISPSMRARLRVVAIHSAIPLLILLFVIVYFSKNIFITVQAGEGGVMWRRFMKGTVTDRVLGEGFHIIPPWDKIAIYSVRVQEVRPELDVLTKEGLRVHLQLSIRYHPEYNMLGILHQRLGSNYVNNIIIPTVDSTMRTTIGTYTLDELYMSQPALLPRIINEALQHASRNFVVIDAVIIRTIELPPALRDAIVSKLEQKQLAEAYQYRLERERQEAERKAIEAGGISRYNTIITNSLTESVLRWKGVEATRELAASTNAKVIMIGNSAGGLPVILNVEK